MASQIPTLHNLASPWVYSAESLRSRWGFVFVLVCMCWHLHVRLGDREALKRCVYLSCACAGCTCECVWYSLLTSHWKKEAILYPSLALHGISNNLLAIYTPGMLITLLLHSPNNSANIREQKQASYQVAWGNVETIFRDNIPFYFKPPYKQATSSHPHNSSWQTVYKLTLLLCFLFSR